jgi:hypothetical protein
MFGVTKEVMFKGEPIKSEKRTESPNKFEIWFGKSKRIKKSEGYKTYIEPWNILVCRGWGILVK